MLYCVYQACVGGEEPLAEEFRLPLGFGYWVVVAVSHSQEMVSTSPFAYLGHVPDVPCVFCLVKVVMCPFFLRFHEGHAEGFSGLLPINPIPGIAGHYMSSRALFRPPCSSPQIGGVFWFEGLSTCIYNSTVEVFYESIKVFMGCDPAMDDRQVNWHCAMRGRIWQAWG
jgi:hypothetical protein